MAGPLWIKESSSSTASCATRLPGYEGEILYAEHHESHAASAFFPSPFEEAAILTMDGVGEWATASFGVGRGNDLEILQELRWPDSLGLLYSAFTYYTGFKVNSGEYKVMGLAPYGEPKYVDLIYKQLIDLRDDGSFTLNQRVLQLPDRPHDDERARSTSCSAARRASRRRSSRSARWISRARCRWSARRSCCAWRARCTARPGCDEPVPRRRRGAQLRRQRPAAARGPFKELWIQPAAGDAGGALGVAQLDLAPAHAAASRTVDGRQGQHEGRLPRPELTRPRRSRRFSTATGASYQRARARGRCCERVAQQLAEEKVVGWFNGRMEFGPRALGARSILGDPRSPRMQAQMNIKIKFREGFRPFAPSVLRERVSDYFELDCDSPYMLLVAPVKKERQIPMTDGGAELWGIDQLNVPRSDIPAVTHIDYSARVQTVSRETNPDYYDLIARVRAADRAARSS